MKIFRLFQTTPFFMILVILGFTGTSSGQVFREYYSNGTLKFELKRDKKRQIIRGYYPSGALEFSASYRKGELDGVTREYYENGFLKAEINYKDNKRHGIAKFYYVNGMMMGKILYKRGKETGEMKFYDENGILTGSRPKLKRRARRAKRYEVHKPDVVDSTKIKK